MAFPTIQTADTTNGTVTTNATSWTLTYPGNIAANDLLVILVAADGGTNQYQASGAGFTAYTESVSSNVSVGALAKKAAGTETGTFTLTLSNSEQGGWRIFRITGWFAGAVTNNGDSISVATTATGSPSLNPDPPNLDPAGWATEDTLWIAACGVDTSRTISVYPLADNNTADVSGGSNGATLGVCTANSAVSSLNPGTFTISNSDDWGALTMAIRPSAAGGTTYQKAGYGKEHG